MNADEKKAEQRTEIRPMRPERRVENILDESRVERRRRSSDVIADFLDLDVTVVDHYIEALHSTRPEVVSAAKSSLRMAYPDESRRQDIVEVVKARAEEEWKSRLDKQITRCDAVLSGAPGTECRHLINQENRILKWVIITFVAAVVLMGVLGFIAWSLRQAAASYRPLVSITHTAGR